ncbi:hypothetical protein [Microbacterium sp. CGR1]|uniref:hypothetical protein n=1 Tax=Microbacterium sp. CGR1 TaxID=1696072 RepID=UPI003DA51033
MSVNCAVGDLAPGATAAVNITGTWAATASGTIRNTATTTSATPDPVMTNNTSSVDVALTPSADVSVVKTTSTPSIPLGGVASFVITVRNDGPSAAAGVVVTEVAPAGLEVTSATPSAGIWSPADHQWTVGTLLPGESATLTVTATATVVGTLTNNATATSPTPDPDPSDNTGTSTVVVTPSADLSIVKTSSANPAPVNGPISYTIVVKNNPDVCAGRVHADPGRHRCGGRAQHGFGHGRRPRRDGVGHGIRLRRHRPDRRHRSAEERRPGAGRERRRVHRRR